MVSFLCSYLDVGWFPVGSCKILVHACCQRNFHCDTLYRLVALVLSSQQTRKFRQERIKLIKVSSSVAALTSWMIQPFSCVGTDHQRIAKLDRENEVAPPSKVDASVGRVCALFHYSVTAAYSIPHIRQCKLLALNWSCPRRSLRRRSMRNQLSFRSMNLVKPSQAHKFLASSSAYWVSSFEVCTFTPQIQDTQSSSRIRHREKAWDQESLDEYQHVAYIHFSTSIRH